GNNLLLTVSNAVDIWLEGGTPPSKLVLGMGLYGRSFTLRGQQTGIGAPVSGPGTPGVSTREDGFLSYYEICNKLQDGQLTRVWDVRRRVPYAFHGNQWVGYDDKRSIRVKVDFLKEKGLGGAMVWAIDLDDFNGDCGETWPLMKAINRRLAFDATSSPATDELVTDPPATDAPATNAPATNVPATEISATDTPATDARITDALATDALSTDAPATNAPAGDVSATNVPATDGRITDALATNALSTDAPATNASSRTHSPDAGTFTCRDKPNGYYADPNSCRMYYICNQGVASYLPCGTGLYFDPQTYTCNYPGNVQCNAPDTPLFCDDRADGHYADPADCSKFYQCANGFTYLTSCQDGLLWNSHINSCDWPRNVKCDRNEVFSCDGREHGYYGDPSDCAGYYHCAGGKTYRFSCGGDLYWNAQVGGCDYPSNVQCTI
ncbi:chitotriosidase-1-like, partial [Acanthaster planci]|uniref:Chitotriosidase-1-like n=1 Tax=Acanthaster planci TaxID=133434 RepID=A0A8B7ZQR3_ACAPL